MNNTAFLLFYEFFKTGLLTFGGGYASLPFLYHISDTYNWFSKSELTQLIAISGITPGPIGLNMATFSGFKTLGFEGAIISSIALVIPMLIITGLVFRLYKKFKENKFVQSILYVLRPTSCALIASVGLKLFYQLILKSSFHLSEIDLYALILIFILFVLTFRLGRNPILYMLVAGLFGAIVYFL